MHAPDCCSGCPHCNGRVAMTPEDDDDGGGGGMKCCVEEFQYPAAWSPYFEDGNLGVEFTASAAFSDEPPCVCECCAFRQYVRVDPYPAPVEDCQVEFPRDSGNWTPIAALLFERRDEKRTPDQVLGEDPEGQVVCAGDRGVPERAQRNGRGRTVNEIIEQASHTKYTECEMFFEDRPGRQVGAENPATFEAEFIGVIIDQCKNGIIVAEASFTVSLVAENPPGEPPPEVQDVSTAQGGSGQGDIARRGLPGSAR